MQSVVGALPEYFYVFTHTICQPGSQFTSTDARLSPRLFVYVVFSVFLGTTINALIPGRIAAPELKTIFVLTIVCWFAYGTLVHFICKLLRGKGSYIDTLSMSLQLISTLYVVSSFGSLILSLLTQILLVFVSLSNAHEIFELVVNSPVSLFFCLEFFLLFIYVPIAIRPVHGFSWARQLSVGLLVPTIILLLNVLIYINLGVLQAQF